MLSGHIYDPFDGFYFICSGRPIEEPECVIIKYTQVQIITQGHNIMHS